MDLPGPIHEILVLFGGFVLLLGGKLIIAAIQFELSMEY